MEFDNTGRRHPRIPANICGWLTFLGQPSCGVLSLDLSQEGARFNVRRPVQPNQQVLVCLQFPESGRWMECKGEIRWCRPDEKGLHALGIRFLDLAEEERDDLNEYLAVRSSRKAAFAAV